MRMTAGRVIMLAGLAVLSGCGGKDTPAPVTATFTDTRDGKIYKTVTINGKNWFAENVNYDIPNDTLDVCYNNDTVNCAKYGRLYDWFAAKQAACPVGWRLPDSAEWAALVAFAGGKETAGKKLKAKSGWDGGYKGKANKPANGTDDYGFAALPGGYRLFDDAFVWGGSMGFWWSATEDVRDDVDPYFQIGITEEYVKMKKAFEWSMSCIDHRVIRNGLGSKAMLRYSVRCVEERF